ncbi:MAG: hypothetical protein IJC51_01615 [Eggerthellaceae bacterium]|nr:hypothetical protein [Eggerthellaceae bacterium]
MKMTLGRQAKQSFPKTIHFDAPAVRPEEYFVIDFETHSLDPEKPVTEAAIVLVRDGAVKRTFSSLVRLERPQTPQVAALTGITDEMLAGAPDLFEVARRLGGFIGTEARPIFAHNMPFDARVIWCHGIADMILPECVFCDTIALSKTAFPNLNQYSLEYLSDKLNLGGDEHHRALADALTTARLIERCYDEIEKKHNMFVVEDAPACPHCGSIFLAKAGFDAQGNQRYTCKECGAKHVATVSRSATSLNPKPKKPRKPLTMLRNITVAEARRLHGDGLLHCPNCGSTDLRKQEKRPNGCRRYLCKSCGKKTAFWEE